jgi:succinoglycan biosynthesis transport protein ExoP
MRENVRALGAGNDGAIPWGGELDVRALGRTLWGRRWWVLGPALAVTLAASVLVNLLTPKYKSEARILIEGRENVFLRPEAEKPGDRDQALVDQEAVTSQVQLALSRDLARQVIRQLKLGESPEFDPILNGVSPVIYALRLAGIGRDSLQMTAEERALEAYYDRLSVYQVEKSRVIAVEFTSADPELAAKVANTIAESFVALHRAAKQDETRAAGRWLAGEIDSLRHKVAESEARVEEFRAKSNLFIGANNTSLSNQQLAEVNSQLTAARSRKAESEAKAQFIREMLRTGKSLESTDFLNSELIRRLAEQRVTLRAQLAEQSSTLLDGHPRIKELKAQIADLDRAIRDEAEKLVRSLENDARIAGARVESLNNNLDQLKRQAASSNGQDVQLRALEREAKSQRDLLESYLAKYRETTARDSLTAMPSEARVISRAVVSNTPFFPKKMPIVLIAAMATLFVALGWVTTRELLAGDPYRLPAGHDFAAADAAVPEPESESAQSLGPAAVAAAAVPPVAPVTVAPSPAAPSLAAAAEPAFPSTGYLLADVAAELRRLDRRRILVAGADRDSGSTAAALALARVLAQEARVVVVDLALAAPRLAAASVDPGGPGLADLVRGTASFGQIITRDRSSRVHLVPAGRIRDDADAILGSERLHIGIEALTQAYDYVVIDAGPAPDMQLAPLRELASSAVLIAAALPDAIAAAAKERLVAAGIADVSVLTALQCGCGAQAAA